MDKAIKKLEEMKTKTSNYCYTNLLSDIDHNKKIKGLTDEEVEILREAYGTTRNDKQNT